MSLRCKQRGARDKMLSFTSDDLIAIDFSEIGTWRLDGDDLDYALQDERQSEIAAMMRAPNALYAFVRDSQILYIGKTARSLRNRFRGYRRPGARQRTNLKCNRRIRELLNDGAEVRILCFVPISQLRYGDFEINLAAGLEDALIRRINPPWNGGDTGIALSETAEREEAEEDDVGVLLAPPAKSETRFSIVLGQTYYQRGLINLGAAPSALLGADGEVILITFEDGWPPLTSEINRRANRSGGVRIVRNVRPMAEWFQAHFNEGDVVTFQVNDANSLTFLGKGTA